MVGAHRPDVDLRRQSEVQNLRHDVGRLEIERAFGKCGGQHLTQFLDIIGGRLVALLQLDLDDTVVDSDRGTVRECQIVGSRRQPDIVDNEPAVLFRNDFADLVLDLLEYRLGAFDAGPGGSANVKLDLAAVDQREKVPANEQQHYCAEAEYQARRQQVRWPAGASSSVRIFTYPSRSRSKPRSNAADIREKKPGGVPSSVP